MSQVIFTAHAAECAAALGQTTSTKYHMAVDVICSQTIL